MVITVASRATEAACVRRSKGKPHSRNRTKQAVARIALPLSFADEPVLLVGPSPLNAAHCGRAAQGQCHWRARYSCRPTVDAQEQPIEDDKHNHDYQAHHPGGRLHGGKLTGMVKRTEDQCNPRDRMDFFFNKQNF